MFVTARCLHHRENNYETNFRAFPLKCLATALVAGVNSFSSITKRRGGVKCVSCEVRPGNENNENKYVPRVQHVRCPRRSRYVCYSGIDFAKDENVFRRTRLNAVCRAESELAYDVVPLSMAR